MHHFTPWSALLGGALIGIAASLLLVASGRIAGISGIVAGLFSRRPGDVAWRGAFLAGLLLAGFGAVLFTPERLGPSPQNLVGLAIAGLLVGVGTRLGDGCTSGHGVCGLSRLSPRSLVATLTFIASGVITVLVVRALGGPS